MKKQRREQEVIFSKILNKEERNAYEARVVWEFIEKVK